MLRRLRDSRTNSESGDRGNSRRNTRSNSRRKAALHLAAMAGVLALAGGFVAQSASPAHAELTLEGGLLVSTREDFRLCVSTTGELDNPRQARAELVSGLAQVQKHPDWEAAFGAPPARAAVAAADTCPSVRLPESVERTTIVGPGVTEDPTPYRTWVHILDERTADRVLGAGVQAATAPAEIMFDADRRGATVSTAVLVRAGHLDDQTFRRGLLTEGIGLLPTVKAPDLSASVHSVKGAPETDEGADKGGER
ncbi:MULTISPECIES: hypothetical protein [Streptomyces]|uniref:hypothetical protein n=1 Tax=Streptomyces TaxID=1883 RepID=UPI001180F21E|nr:hypothetical protein [Streptomyces barkulensis]